MRLPAFIRNLPLRRKVTLLLLTPCLAVLLVAGGALFTFQARLLREEFRRDLEAVAALVSASVVPALEEDQPARANAVLQSLEHRRHLREAQLVLPNGRVFARFGQEQAPSAYSLEPQFSSDAGRAVLVWPVVRGERQLAALRLVSDRRRVSQVQLQYAGWLLLLVAMVGAAVAALLSSWLERLISAPVRCLAEAARIVAEQNDYSVRVYEGAGVELHQLARTFNQMLARIQEQDAALTRSQQKLEALIHSIEGIVWECTPDMERFGFVSRQCERLLGYPAETWMATPGFWQDHLHPEDAVRAAGFDRLQAGAAGSYSLEYRMRAADGRSVWLRESASLLHEDGRPAALRGIFLDITAQKQAAEELEQLNRRLIEASRQAGMAEVATGVLHNVGNVLNSLSVSAALVSDRLKESKIPNLRRAVALLREQNGNLAVFLTEDPKGRVLP